ncbi:hypothetical protein PRECH8_17180 [Insulibacter thermoxylanivorax]|uniref:Uncharacterized protein n=1 Tax=Insulibacter thermoxylanivorax TaxID=2749268 RepID=A0A916VFL4_9BACL|nr:hypothetical protein PRECH8_17180 [Insulibacter thermoxylanivorax]
MMLRWNGWSKQGSQMDPIRSRADNRWGGYARQKQVRPSRCRPQMVDIIGLDGFAAGQSCDIG